MQHDIDEVMRSGIQAKQLAIRHVGKPGEWMPVRLVETESPIYIVETQTCRDVNVPGDIYAVIQGEELIMDDPTVQQQSGKHEECAQQQACLAKIADPSFKERGAHRCDLIGRSCC